MATEAQVAGIFRDVLERDSPTQLDKAGNLWPDLPLRFFYLTFANDNIDLAVEEVTLRVADADQITIPGDVISGLQDVIGPDTIVGRAVRMIFLTTFQPS